MAEQEKKKGARKRRFYDCNVRLEPKTKKTRESGIDREIKYLQEEYEGLLIPKAPFRRIVRLFLFFNFE